MELLSIRASNNNFETLQNVTIHVDDNGGKQSIDNMGPFSSVMITPNREDRNFDKVIVEGNNGTITYVHTR